ncbi:hypothetical protein ACOMHN_060038 [Nucella lapillus]
MALYVKAYLEKNDDVKGEIRRFQVPEGTVDLYRKLVIKVAEIFSLPENTFQLFWQDNDGDFVTFSSTAELKEAVHHSADEVFRVFIKRTAAQDNKTTGGDKGGEKTSEEKIRHPGVVCDGCEGSIYGPRFKCVICPDYDLCATCEQKGIHPEHDKFKITHPQTAGGHGGFMPPHFRRWMHRFMKKYPAGHGQWQQTGGATAAGESSSSAGESSSGAQPQGPSASATGDEFLNNIGANIASFLDPFGIDVSYEVQHNGEEKKKGQFRGPAQGAGACGRGTGSGVWHWDIFGNGGGCTRMPQGAGPSASTEGKKPAEKATPEEATEKAAEKAAAEAAEKSAKQAAAEAAEKAAEQKAEEEAEKDAEMEEVLVTFEEEATAPKTAEAPRSKDASPTGSHDDDWTMLNEGETAVDGEGASASQSAPREGIYPNLKVTQAVEMMRAMGFNDEGGWLTRLLETTEGDIAQALDTLKLGAQQASSLS